MAEEHKCIHESDWAITRDHVRDMGADLKLVLKMLRGNGDNGLITEIALIKQSLKRLHERIDENDKSIKNINTKAWGAMATVVTLVLVLGVKHLIGV